MEVYFQHKETENLKKLIIQDYEAVYEGQYTVKEEINRNISAYLKNHIWFKLGIGVNILIKSKDGRVLFPAQFEDSKDGASSTLAVQSLNYLDMAADNYKILNNGLDDQKEMKETKESELRMLRDEFEQIQGRLKDSKRKSKTVANISKRFAVLYKNVIMTDKAIDGFLALSNEFQLRAEEVIHKLNEDDSTVQIKRKVFGKGGKMNILEVVFSYSGRLYFQKHQNNKINVVAIGSKKTQDKDIAYLEREG